MEVKAKLNYLRIAPRKIRLVADMIRRKKVEEAQIILGFAKKRGARPLLKLLNSALANAKNNFQLDADNLYISKITVDEGPKLKRWMPRARGRASEIQKKTSHITLILNEIKPSSKKKKGEKKQDLSRTRLGKRTSSSKILPKKEKKESLLKKAENKKLESAAGEEKVREERTERKFKPKDASKEILRPKRPGVFKRIFRRKSI